MGEGDFLAMASSIFEQRQDDWPRLRTAREDIEAKVEADIPVSASSILDGWQC